MRRGFALLMFAIAAGCASAPMDIDREALTDLQRDRADPAGRTYLYTAHTSIGYSADDPQAEAVRMQWLGDWLRLNKACTHGHDVLGKETTKISDKPSGTRFTYTVRCR